MPARTAPAKVRSTGSAARRHFFRSSLRTAFHLTACAFKRAFRVVIARTEAAKTQKPHPKMKPQMAKDRKVSHVCCRHRKDRWAPEKLQCSCSKEWATQGGPHEMVLVQLETLVALNGLGLLPASCMECAGTLVHL